MTSKLRYLRVNIAIGAIPADVHLILSGFLVHRVVKVDGVGVLLTPVPPQQHSSKQQQGHDHYRAGDKSWRTGGEIRVGK